MISSESEVESLVSDSDDISHNSFRSSNCSETSKKLSVPKSVNNKKEALAGRKAKSMVVEETLTNNLALKNKSPSP